MTDRLCSFLFAAGLVLMLALIMAIKHMEGKV